ncbi:MAG: glycosyltransferase family 4 protein [Pseudomonadota bacterium]
MRTILQVLPGLDSGGVERTAVDVSRAVVTNGWRSLVASSGGRLVGQVEMDGGQHLPMTLASKNPLTIWRNAGRLEQLIGQEKIDLVHARSRAPAWSAYIAAKRAGIPFVTTYAAIYNQKSPVKAWYNSVMAKGDVVIANSNWTARIVRERRPEATDRIIAIPRGVDFSNFDRSAILPERELRLRQDWGVGATERLVVMVSRLTRLKGHRTIIDAAPAVLMANPNVRFVLAGGAGKSSDYEGELRARIAELDLTDRIILPGHCDDPAAAAATATVMVQASTQAEAFGRTPVEAAALGTPVVATAIGAVSDTILTPPTVSEDQRTGWTYPPGDAKALADALNMILAMPGAALGKVTTRAHTHATTRFSLEAMGNATLDVYRSLLKDC